MNVKETKVLVTHLGFNIGFNDRANDVNAMMTFDTGKKNTRQKGFSLIEVLVVLAIMVVISAIAAPAYKGYVNSTNYQAAVNGARSAFALARKASVQYGQNIVVSFDGGAIVVTRQRIINGILNPIVLQRVDMNDVGVVMQDASQTALAVNAITYDARGRLPQNFFMQFTSGSGSTGSFALTRSGNLQ